MLNHVKHKTFLWTYSSKKEKKLSNNPHPNNKADFLFSSVYLYCVMFTI